ncbi:hypothetical protein M409DRAFT_27228 [Zasmidium cellare ATCC 36951]|uniref:Uncharacterized protein n=1 Tax=Zasmidium cellare ATCC 36951 TaxID=1080233 RepID=A0A6A6C8K5_ZASCE|nr:uncharacterized protein M409DRAFT_27228 [Zasmidium cellare ATCC 36951]KAF2162222.1 hypothetical protein M409DRAFT_27228 [Zasmidium cellare ATCC 36951]
MTIQSIRRSKRLKRQARSPTTDSPNGPANRQASLLGLSPELRLQIYQDIVVDERPFMIGRYQEDTKNKTRGGPRDFYLGKHTVRRDDRPHPPITRVCRLLREEALPLYYQENHFWLIHNEFRNEDDHGGRQSRCFDAWLAQTPSRMFNIMRHVSLCGYAAWPNRIMITVDLKSRKAVAVKEYSTYGDQLPLHRDEVRSVEETLERSSRKDGLAALKALLVEYDWMFDLHTQHISAPPGMSRLRKPMEGPEYDW